MTRTELIRYPWRALLIALVVFVAAMLLIEAHAQEFECSKRKAQTGGRFNYPMDCGALEWDASEGATYYVVQRKLYGPFGGLWTEWEPVDTTEGELETDLLAHSPEYIHARRYLIRVQACNFYGCSPLSRSRVWVRRLR